MNDDFFWQWIFLNSPEGEKFIANFQEQQRSLFISLQKSYDETVKKNSDTINKKIVEMQKLYDEIQSLLGFK